MALQRLYEVIPEPVLRMPVLYWASLNWSGTFYLSLGLAHLAESVAVIARLFDGFFQGGASGRMQDLCRCKRYAH